MKRLLRRAFTIILLLSALMVVVTHALAAFSFPVLGPVHVGSIAAGDKVQSDDMPPPGNRAVGEGDNGRSFSADRGEVLIVHLKETDPAQSWRYTGQGSFSIIDETVLESYPAVHDFRVRVKGPGDLMFAKVDSRSGDVVERFGVHVVIREPGPRGEILTRYPLYDFFAVSLSPGLLSQWR
ncbi:MAG: hypothetical protein A4E28_00352 [Methanocella sp. PtaU1.Bin125]|nr:MAG: hypothetical protein A4E28_00352 [Methanocella sp. PtaU1.Bin125]